ncbi:MAG: hypothetical protein BWY57_02549 [Betaproteobacteria bacterium ADurb.Bin341]|nr:MAG: hypothetical protein BWY57_02549 [Betaproteobacteria bacterium ADurb.Bin341]
MNDSRRHKAMRQAAAGKLDCGECRRDLLAAKNGDQAAQARMKARGWTAVDMILHGCERLASCSARSEAE